MISPLKTKERGEIKMNPSNKENRLKQLWEQLLKLRPTNEQLFSVITEIEPLREIGINQLWKQGATKEELIALMLLDESLSPGIQKLLDLRNERDQTIQEILKEMKSLIRGE